MELDCSFFDFENEKNEGYRNTEKSVVPDFGSFLGLDISESSTGVCIYERGIRFTYNFSLNLVENSVHSEVLLRRALKENLRSVIKDKELDVIIIEDVFQGINAMTTRKLYAINTAIDEMILDGEVKCKKFLRVSNQTWKSWLFRIDEQGVTKGMNDKLRIETCLGMLGIVEVGKGFQDRLDATGMIIGYLLDPEYALNNLMLSKRKKVSFEDIVISYNLEKEDVFADMQGYKVKEYKEVEEKRWSKSKIIDYLTNNPKSAYITKDYVILGNLADSLDLPIITDGGILGFWLKPNKIEKYVGKE